jgi:3-oxo-5alpha-steroid 4-dehydrogenase
VLVKDRTWDAVADVVVVGFGGAGVCAALEAADAGADVLALERFNGGGATAMSGGVVYAGGGTEEQRAAGIADDPEDMFRYLQLETAGAVSDRTLRRFCDDSVATIGWLKERGVGFDGRSAPYPTSYPAKGYYLYDAGNEQAGPARAVATPAQRGHRVHGRGPSGEALFEALRTSARRRGVRLQTGTRATSLVTDGDDRVVGVECTTIHKAPRRVRREHRALARRLTRPSGWHRPPDRKISDRLEQIERRFGRTWRVRATRGVVLAAGGFTANTAMVQEHGPRYAFGLPLGTLADDGSGIELGETAGGATRHLDRFSAWRFFTPPSALAKGVLLGPGGERICNEELYGATVAEHVIHSHGGRAYLLVDSRVADEARGQVQEQTRWFQRQQAQSMLGSGSVTGMTVADVAAKAGMDVAVAQATVAAYNAVAESGADDPLGKRPEQVQPLDQEPFLLVDVSVRPSTRFPCPVMSLGGLVVDEDSGQVLRDDASAVDGLYAAGRTAVGICSTSYVSGLSLADCVFSGRRAGRAVAASGAEVSEALR